MTVALPVRPVGDSWLARCDGRWRLLAFLVLVGSAATVQTPSGGAVVLSFALVAATLGRVSARAIAARLGLLALGVAPLLVVGHLLGPAGSPVTLGLRVAAVGVAGLTLAYAAPIGDTFTAARGLGLPRVLCEVGRSAERHSTVFARELRRTHTALRTRGFVVARSRHTVRTLGHSLAGLLVRADDRAGRVAIAMRTRGYAGITRPATRPATGFREVILVLGAIAAALLALRLDRAGS